jgi:hypothetical protein
MINITIGTPTKSKRFHTSHDKQKDLGNFLQFSSTWTKEIFYIHASKGATIVAIGPPSNKALQLKARILSLGIPKHNAHMVNRKVLLGGDLEEPFNVGENLIRSQDAGL